MKRLFGLSLVVAGMFGIGTNALAQNTTAILASSSEFAEEQIIILYSGDPNSNPYLQSLLTKLSSFYDMDNFFIPVESTKVVETAEQTLQSGTTAGTGTANNTETATGNGNGVTTTTQTVVSQPKAIWSDKTTLRFTEVYPNTNGNDAEEEFVVIENTGTEPINLKGWKIKDESGKTTAFESDLVVAGGSQTKLTRAQTDLALNNDIDSVYLFAPDNSLIDSIKYENPKKGETYKLVNGVWSWPTTIKTNEPAPVSTSQSANVVVDSIPAATTETITTTTVQSEPAKIDKTEPKEMKEAAKPKTTDVKLTVSTSIAEAKNLPDQTDVSVSAVVSVLPTTLGKQFFYVQDDTGGIQIYKHDAVFPELVIGQQVKIKGELSTNGNERRIKVNKNGSIDVLEQTTVVEPQKTIISELKTDQIGKLFKVSGMINENSPNQLLIEDNGSKLVVAISDQTGIDTNQLIPGTSVEIVGVVRSSGDEIKLSPRSQEDIVVLQKTESVAAGIIENGKNKQNNTDQKLALALSAVSGLTLVVFVIRHLIKKQKITYATDRSVELTAENIH